MDKLEELRMLAIRRALGEVVRADLLIEAALRAMLDGVDSSSLVLLAGLSRAEDPEAQASFGQPLPN